eukprot:6489691-Amphidinium_carterae.2
MGIVYARNICHVAPLQIMISYPERWWVLLLTARTSVVEYADEKWRKLPDDDDDDEEEEEERQQILTSCVSRITTH